MIKVYGYDTVCEGDACESRPFFTGEIIYHDYELDGYYCGKCAVKLEVEYKTQFDEKVYVDRSEMKK
ncbi:hypothetical protein [Bacillus massiliigorillae]|uniref:hypothetical protein n=1 Tax=Bacillus massiliigorillae TaxID=1243664 RepID=UPI0003A6AA49|nr:hypothetical protein [Bacillus massiliigorillae]